MLGLFGVGKKKISQSGGGRTWLDARVHWLTPAISAILGLILLAPILALVCFPGSTLAAFLFAGDEFQTVAYNNNDGTINWAGDWTELNDDGNPASGNVLITGGELRLDNQDTGSLEGVRRTVDLSSASRATLTFDFRTSNTLDNADLFNVDVSGDGGTNWTNLEQFVNDRQGSRVYDISGYISNNTTIRFQVAGGYSGATDYFYLARVRVTEFFDSSHVSTDVLPTVQIYYIPIPEDQLYTAITTIFDPIACGVDYGIYNPSQPTNSYVSIAIVANGTVIYVDHWEDGFETRVNDPQQTSSEVWGDNDMANGAPPGFTSDVLQAGQVVLLANPVASATRQSILDYDGGDKIASTQAIAMTRLGWASGSDTLLASGVSLLDTSVWGTQFDAPVGEDIPTGTDNDMFEYTGMVVMAAQDNTVVNLNSVQVATLNQGQSYQFNGGLNTGDVVTTSAPVQAHLITGDRCAGYESRSFTLYPTELWSDGYYNPVSTPDTGTGDALDPTYVFLYNPNGSAITVNWETTAGVQTPQNIAAGGVARVVMPNGTGAHFYTSDGSEFFAVTTIDSDATDNLSHDWGFGLIPDLQLTQQAFVGYGYGQDPTKPYTENGSPVWVTVDLPSGGSGTQPFSICVDYNGDSSGLLTDSNGRAYDALLSLNRLQRVTVYDPDGDQTAMLLYVCDGSDAEIAVAWGQDPTTASVSTPGFDLGTAVPPLPNFTAVKGAELTNDINHDGRFDVGESFAYNIIIQNSGALPVPANSLLVSDIVPDYTLYLLNSTTFDDGSTVVSIPDNTSPATAFPLDEGGYLISQTLPIEGVFTITFQVRINADLPGETTIQNAASVSGLDLYYFPKVEIVVQPPDENSRLGDFIWLDLDGDGSQDAGEPGLPGVTLELYDGSCTQGVDCLTTVTDASGNYTFPNLITNTYTVLVDMGSLPANLAQTFDPDGPCPGPACDGQHSVAINAGNTPYLLADFGYQGDVSIGDYVWEDIDGDGVQDAGEPPLSGVTIRLTWAGPDGILDTSDDLTLSDTTDASGLYGFSSLPAGTFRVDLDEGTLPAGYIVTTTNPLVLNNLPGGTSYTEADFGANANVSIGDLVWQDLDGDGSQDAGEPGISGVTLNLTWAGPDGDLGTSGDNLTFSATSGGDGGYDFTHLPAGTFLVALDTGSLPAGMSLTTSNPLTLTNLTAGTDYNDADFGARGTASIGDLIWNDLDGDGIRDSGEPGIPGVVVELSLPGGGTITTVTDASGAYSFSGLSAGAHTITVRTSSLPPGLSQTWDPDETGACTTCDSQHTYTLGAGESYTSADFGYRGTVSLGDKVWEDLNNNGSDDGEPGVGGVMLWVTYAGPDGAFGTSDDMAYSAVTDGNGAYSLSGLPDGNYRVTLNENSLPAGYSLSTANPITTGVLTGPTSYLNADFGVVTASLEISKASSAGGIVDPGETVTYTIVVTNSGPDWMTGIAISDTLPTGTSPITNSTWVTYPFTPTVRDEFNAVSYGDNDGNTNWLADWVESDGGGGGASGGAIRITTGGELRLRDNVTGTPNIARAADLSGASMAVLSFNFRTVGLEADDSLVLEVSPGGTGGTYTTVENFTGLVGAVSGTRTYVLNDFVTLSANTAVRFRVADFDNADDTFYMDNLQIASYPAPLDVLDQFGSVAYNNNNGSRNWSTNWDETNDDDLPGSGEVWITGGQLRLSSSSSTANQSITRSVNLSAYPKAILSYTFGSSANLEDADQLQVQVSTSPSGPWSPLETFSNDHSGARAWDISAYISSSTSLRFAITGSTSGSGEYFSFDDVRIRFTDYGTRTQAGGEPPGLTTALDGYQLESGQSMQVTFQVLVDNPTPWNQAWIRNTAWVTSNEQPTPQRASTADRISTPTAVTVSGFTARSLPGHVVIGWETASEINTVGFNIYRCVGEDGARTRLNEVLIPSQAVGGFFGASYQFVDASVEPGVTYTYWLEEVDLEGNMTMYESVQVLAVTGVYLPLVAR